MSIRIYALAKQLKKESKELVDVCKKLGISVKVNPLSSLTEDEAKKISDYFSKGKALSSVRSFVEEGEKIITMQRPPILSAPSGKVPVLQPARPARLSELNRPASEMSKPSDSVRSNEASKSYIDAVKGSDEPNERLGTEERPRNDESVSLNAVSDSERSADERSAISEPAANSSETKDSCGLGVENDHNNVSESVSENVDELAESVKEGVVDVVVTEQDKAAVVVTEQDKADSVVTEQDKVGAVVTEQDKVGVVVTEQDKVGAVVTEQDKADVADGSKVAEFAQASETELRDGLDDQDKSERNIMESSEVSSSESKPQGTVDVSSSKKSSEESTGAAGIRENSVVAEEQKMESERKVESVSTVVAGEGKASDSSVVAPAQEIKKPEVPVTSAPSGASVQGANVSAQRNLPSAADSKKAPVREALERRDNQRGFRRSNDRDSSRGDASRGRGSNVEIKPPRPVPPIVRQQESRAQILDEMKRPPMITPPHGDKLRVFELPRKNKKDDAKKEDANGSNNSQRPNGARPSVALHLAPMPTQAPKATKKAVKEPAAQKPEMRLPPEALRAAARGVMGPLAEHIRRVEEGNRLQASEQGGRSRDKDGRDKDGRDRDGRDRDGRKGAQGVKDAKDGGRFQRDDRGARSVRGDGKLNDAGFGASNDFGSSNKRGKKSSTREHDGEGREDVRNSKRRQGNDARRFHDDDSEYRPSSRVGRSRKDRGVSSTVTAPRKGDVMIETPCTVKQFAEATGISVAVVIKKLMELGYMLTLNQSLDADVIELLIVAFELKATVKEEASLEEKFVEPLIDQEDAPEDLVPRAPVVTFLGHVDHGKTSLLDRILNLHVVSGEKGGITQHIRAYRVTTPRGAVTFVDTPGHEAFTEMRARGANCTDVAVLVVAADDGVMPQTEEAISHAKAAGVPIVVALNKMDLPGVNRDKVVQELASNDLMPSEWGGDVEIVETSAITGMGVDDLLDTLLTVAELNELKANPNRPANGVVLEASLQSGEGVVCKALVQNGTLRNGDVVLCGCSYGRVRSMADTLDSHKRIKEAGPSVPVSLVGLDVPPEAGSKFVVLEDVSIARQIAEERAKRAREVELAGAPGHVTLENLFERMNSSKTQQTLNVVIRADVRGSIEAIRKELGKLEHPEVKVKILQASVGGITEADVHLADASDAIIVGFNVVPDEGARALAETKKVQVRRYDVIYKLTEDIRAALEGMLKPIEQVKELGRALVQRAFNISRVGVIAGCRVLYGVIERDCQIRVIRDSRIIGEYQLETLKREKDDVKEVRDGYECGMKLKNFNDVKEGDVLEAYKIEEVARTL